MSDRAAQFAPKTVAKGSPASVVPLIGRNDTSVEFISKQNITNRFYVKDYIDARANPSGMDLKAKEVLDKSMDLARRSANAFGQQIFESNKGVFVLNQMKGIEKSLATLDENMGRELVKFREQYQVRDESMLQAAYDEARKGLINMAQIASPTVKGNLFGFIPIKVSPALNMAIGTFTAAVTAGVGSWLSVPSTGASTGAGGGALAAPTTVVGVSGGQVVTTTGFVADLGIRGAQAANLAATGATPGASFGLTGLTSANLGLGAAGGLVSSAPKVAAVSPQALRLGVTVPSTPKLGIVQMVQDKLSKTYVQAKEYVVNNPGKTALTAAGTGLTLKSVADSPNPFAALVNTITGAVGLGPVIPIKPNGPSPVPPSNLFSGPGGGGGGGLGSFGGSNIFSTGSSLLVFLTFGVGILILTAIFLRKR